MTYQHSGHPTETVTATPCQRIRSNGDPCGGTTIKFRPTHGWCGRCGTRRDPRPFVHPEEPSDGEE